MATHIAARLAHTAAATARSADGMMSVSSSPSSSPSGWRGAAALGARRNDNGSGRTRPGSARRDG